MKVSYACEDMDDCDGNKDPDEATFGFSCADLSEYCPGHKTRKTYFDKPSLVELCGEDTHGLVCTEMGAPEIATLILVPALFCLGIFLIIFFRHNV